MRVRKVDSEIERVRERVREKEREQYLMLVQNLLVVANGEMENDKVTSCPAAAPQLSQSPPRPSSYPAFQEQDSLGSSFSLCLLSLSHTLSLHDSLTSSFPALPTQRVHAPAPSHAVYCIHEGKEKTGRETEIRGKCAKRRKILHSTPNISP